MRILSGKRRNYLELGKHAPISELGAKLQKGPLKHVLPTTQTQALLCTLPCALNPPTLRLTNIEVESGHWEDHVPLKQVVFHFTSMLVSRRVSIMERSSFAGDLDLLSIWRAEPYTELFIYIYIQYVCLYVCG